MLIAEQRRENADLTARLQAAEKELIDCAICVNTLYHNAKAGQAPKLLDDLKWVEERLNQARAALAGSPALPKEPADDYYSARRTMERLPVLNDPAISEVVAGLCEEHGDAPPQEGEATCEGCERLREWLISIREFARAHHDQQEPHLWLHALLVDIPAHVDEAVGEGSREERAEFALRAFARSQGLDVEEFRERWRQQMAELADSLRAPAARQPATGEANSRAEEPPMLPHIEQIRQAASGPVTLGGSMEAEYNEDQKRAGSD